MMSEAPEAPIPPTAEQTNLTMPHKSPSPRHFLSGVLARIEDLAEALRALDSLEGEEDPGSTELLDLAQAQAAQIRELIDDLAMLWKLGTGESLGEPREFPLAPLVEAAVDAVHGQDSSDRIRLQLEPEVMISGDQALIERLLHRLAEGIQASFEGEVSMEIRVQSGEAEALVQIDVSPADPVDVLWQAIEASPAVSQDSRPEVELAAMSIMPIVELHEGRTWVLQPGDGHAEINLAFPAVQAAEISAGNRVLIVDDDADGAFMLEQVLLNAGFEPTIASDGLTGLSMARKKPFSLVVLDVMLPGMDGFEVCHRLRSDPATEKVPVLMVSAKGREEDRAMGLRMGADEYMAKPLRLAEVVSTVTRLIERAEQQAHD